MNQQLSFTSVIESAAKLPLVRIDRTKFLTSNLGKFCTPSQLQTAIDEGTLHSGIPIETLDSLANAVINAETIKVTSISAAAGIPGGFAMAATIPADIVQYYGYMLRATQKLMYLYGFPEIDTDEKGHKFDSETINILIICLGVMYGAAGANNALKSMAKALANGVEKKLINAALTKGTIYPIVKSTASWFGKKMTKDVFAGFFKKTIPVVGGVLGGGITFITFKPCCDKLKASLQDTLLSNPNHNADKGANIITIYDISAETI